MLKKIIVLALSLGVSSSAALADVQKVKGGLCALTRTLSMSSLSSQAGVIFKGSLKSIEETTVPLAGQNQNLSARKLSFNVEDGIKGVKGSTYTAYEWLSLSSPFTSGEVEKGQSYVFFFNSPSELTGLSSLVGFEQGLVTFKDGVPQISSRVLKESKMSNGNLSLLGRTRTLNSPSNYSELKSLIERLQ